jgi:hypothetical protein
VFPEGRRPGAGPLDRGWALPFGQNQAQNQRMHAAAYHN